MLIAKGPSHSATDGSVPPSANLSFKHWSQVLIRSVAYATVRIALTRLRFSGKLHLS